MDLSITSDGKGSLLWCFCTTLATDHFLNHSDLDCENSSSLCQNVSLSHLSVEPFLILLHVRST